MKKTLLALALLVVVALGATEPPKMLDGFNYTVLNLVDDDGTTFVAYKIRNKEDWSRFNKKFKKMKHLHTEVNENIVFTTKKFGNYEIVRAWAWGYKSFVVYEE